MKSLLVGTLIVIIGLWGCTTKPTFTEEQMRAAMTRTYKGVSSEQVMQASTKLLKLVDEARFQFKREGSQLTATRSGEIYTGIYSGGVANVTAVWLVKTQEKDQSTVVTIEAGWKRKALSAGITSNIKKPEGTAVYNLFFHRLENLLGKSKDWMTCEEMKQAIKKGEEFGDVRMLCAYTEDKRPGSS